MTPPIVVRPPRFSRYAQQSQPWRRGYNWARLDGAHHDLSVEGAAEAWGYDFDSSEYLEFGRGVDFAQMEQGVRSA
jgi:hypothetical protein